MKPLLLDLFHRHIGLAFHRQVQFADWLASRSADKGWNYGVSTAELVLGGAKKYVAPLVGSYAENNNSWLWAWNNRHLALPDAGLKFAERVKMLAMFAGSSAFLASDALDCVELFGEVVCEHAAHAMGAIVCGLLKYDAYYTIPYTGGRGVAVFHEPELRQPDPHPLLTLTNRYTQLISALPIPDQRAAFRGYAEDLGLTLVEQGDSVTGTLANVGDVIAEFDDLNRLAKLESKTLPQAGATATPDVPKVKPRGSKGPSNPRPK